jgi:enoyl-CoA hydratase
LTIHYSTADAVAQIPVAQIHLDDGKANAMSTDWFAALNEALDRAEKDEVRAVVIRGRSGMFSAGLDLKWLPTLDRAGIARLGERFAETMLRVWNLPVPTIAAVTGHAIAGGCVLASACDKRVGMRGDFRIQMNEVLVKIALPTWAAAVCASSWSPPELHDLLLFGRSFDPDEAHALGFLHGLADDEDGVLAEANDVAAACAQLDRRAFARTKARLRGPETERVKSVLAAEV